MAPKKDHYAGFPRYILGLICPQHRSFKIRQILLYHAKVSKRKATKEELLRHLIVLSIRLSDDEQKRIRDWLLSRGVGRYDEFNIIQPARGKRKVAVKGAARLLIEQVVNEVLPGPSKEQEGLSAVIECSVCMDELPSAEFRREKTTPSCIHPPTTCRNCLKKSIDAQIQETAWDQLSCPVCPERLSFEVVQEFASEEAFQRYDRQSVLSVFRDMPNFMNCLNPNCDSGQIHGGGDDQPIMTCTTCGFKSCYTHKRPWHTGQTCNEYETLQKEQQEQEKASAELIAKSAKIFPNPKCGLYVAKVSGFDHMTCHRCRHQFCWICLASYKAIQNEGNTAHLDTCKYHTDRLNGIPGHNPDVANRLRA